MNECIGNIGKLFGHNFKEFLIDREPTELPVQFTCTGDVLDKIFKHCSKTKYEIRCRRCGCKPDNYQSSTEF